MNAEAIETANTAYSESAPWPSVAVVIPCYNAEQWVAGAIQSVLDQNYPNLKVIVIDDGSTDGSLDVIKTFGNLIGWEAGSNRGACVARNRGLELTQSDYIVFLDADDELGARYLHTGLQACRNIDADMLFTSFLNKYEDNRTSIMSPASRFLLPLDDVLAEWLSGRMAQTASIIWKREFLQRIGAWNERILKGQDWELGLRGLLNYPRYGVSNAAYAIYRHHSSESRMAFQESHLLSENQIKSMDSLLNMVLLRGSPQVKKAMGLRYYGHARYCYVKGWNDLGVHAEKQARALIGNFHKGNALHVLLAKTVGLRRKEWLFQWMRIKLAKVGLLTFFK